jgi:D-Tyr-tRNAtyr deacylase
MHREELTVLLYQFALYGDDRTPARPNHFSTREKVGLKARKLFNSFHTFILRKQGTKNI